MSAGPTHADSTLTLARCFAPNCPARLPFAPATDTWHVYGHLKRELARHHATTRKWILLHDTTVDADVGESIRCRRDIPEQMRLSGYPRAEIERGLWPAIEEFLAEHAEWELEKRYTNNNGLTVLARR